MLKSKTIDGLKLFIFFLIDCTVYQLVKLDRCQQIGRGKKFPTKHLSLNATHVKIIYNANFLVNVLAHNSRPCGTLKKYQQHSFWSILFASTFSSTQPFWRKHLIIFLSLPINSITKSFSTIYGNNILLSLGLGISFFYRYKK